MSGYFRYLPDGSKQELTALEESPYATGTKRHHARDGVKIIYTDTEEAARNSEESAVDPVAYKALRAQAYPDYRDYLDGIVKGDAAQVQKYIADCLAVKARFPK